MHETVQPQICAVSPRDHSTCRFFLDNHHAPASLPHSMYTELPETAHPSLIRHRTQAPLTHRKAERRVAPVKLLHVPSPRAAGRRQPPRNAPRAARGRAAPNTATASTPQPAQQAHTECRRGPPPLHAGSTRHDPPEAARRPRGGRAQGSVQDSRSRANAPVTAHPASEVPSRSAPGSGRRLPLQGGQPMRGPQPPGRQLLD